MRAAFIGLIFFPIVLFSQTQKVSQPSNEDRIQQSVEKAVAEAEARMTQQQTEKVQTLRTEYDPRLRALEQELANIHWLEKTLGLIVGGSVLAGLIWVYVGLPRLIRNRIESQVDLAAYKLDPRYWPIRIPAHNFDAERERLKNLKYRNLKPLVGLDPRCAEGITIFSAATNDDLALLKNFMDDHRVNPYKCFFVIYAKADLDRKILGKYDNFVFCNMPATISPAIFTASRNIDYDIAEISSLRPATG